MLRILKKIIKLLICVAIICTVAIGILLVTEFSPKNGEALKVIGKAEGTIRAQDTINIITYNIGHLVSDEKFDCYFEGGKQIKQDKKVIEENLENILKILEENESNITLLQDVDYKSDISASINGYTEIGNFYEKDSCFAATQDTFVPYPIPDIVGRVKTGLALFSEYTGEACRISLPQNYEFMQRIINPKKCLLKYVIPIEESEQKLVVFNVDFEDYDDGSMRKSQLETLISEMQLEYDKGNLVIAGGDFNMIFKSGDNQNKEVKKYTFVDLDSSILPKDWKVLYDEGANTFRLRNVAYNKEKSITGIVDGYIITPNVKVKSVTTIDTEFKYTNHNPVKLELEI